MHRESEFFRPPVFRVPEIHLTVELSPPAIVSAAQHLKSTVHELVMLVLSLFFRVRIISMLVPCHAAAVRGACHRRTPREALASPCATLACAPRPPGRADARAASCRSRLAHRRLERRAVPPPRHPCAAAAVGYSAAQSRARAGPARAAAARATAQAAVAAGPRPPAPQAARHGVRAWPGRPPVFVSLADGAHGSGVRVDYFL